MRQTNYVNGYGYVTQQDYATQQGHGIFDSPSEKELLIF